mmetsp:Transcript_44553/g.51487  ORF Transcript_44553/g.51487 Transcript_44553/m.51487 type:complete len:138 (-) Transcript_44553:105-518(-)
MSSLFSAGTISIISLRLRVSSTSELSWAFPMKLFHLPTKKPRRITLVWRKEKREMRDQEEEAEAVVAEVAVAVVASAEVSADPEELKKVVKVNKELKVKKLPLTTRLKNKLADEKQKVFKLIAEKNCFLDCVCLLDS